MGQLTSGTVTLAVFRDMISRYNAYVTKYSKKPSKITTTSGGSNYVTLAYYGVMAYNYVQYQKVYGKRPTAVEITLTKKSYGGTTTTTTGTNTSPNTVKGTYQTKIENATGKSWTNFTGFYALVVKYCDYKYYYDDQKSLATEIQNLINSFNGSGSSNGENCVDYCQVGVKIAQEMGYTAVPYGIYCTSSKVNHAIFKISGGEFSSATWIDLAAAASSGYSIGNHWCSGTTTKTPSWIPYE